MLQCRVYALVRNNDILTMTLPRTLFKKVGLEVLLVCVVLLLFVDFPVPCWRGNYGTDLDSCRTTAVRSSSSAGGVFFFFVFWLASRVTTVVEL